MFVSKAEVVGVYEALIWLEERSAQRVTIETDSLIVIRALQKDLDYQFKENNILEIYRT